MTQNRAVIFANGLLPDLEAARRLLRPEDVLIGADAGASHILRLGLSPAVVIGDFDSIPDDDLHTMEASGVHLERHPRDKDQTDLELAIDYTVREKYPQVLVVAAWGGRLDMTLSNLSLMTRPNLLDLEVVMDDGIESACFTKEEIMIDGQPGDTISLFPWEGSVRIERTNGLRWSLTNSVIHANESRSISNELLHEHAEIKVSSGLLLCIHRRNSKS